MIETKEFLKKVEQTKINEEIVNIVETKCNKELPEQVKKMISLSKEPQYGAEWRTLCLDEIINADKDLEYNFSERDQLPLIDAFDNNYIVFDYNDSLWKILNLTEEIDFDESEKLADLLI